MTDIGAVKSYLGIEINYNEKKKIMTLSQAQYIETISKQVECY